MELDLGLGTTSWPVLQPKEVGAPPPDPHPGDDLLLENGDFLLLETGDSLVLE